MVYLLIILSLLLVLMAGMIWLRKVQYDAIHRNFLDLVDHYGGNVIREGFAIRPKFSSSYKDSKISISISSERKSGRKERWFYISAFMQIASPANFSVMSREWLDARDEKTNTDRFIRNIADDQYYVEVSEKQLLRKLDIPKIESTIRDLIPFAYILVSRKGIILERLSGNLLRDTEFASLDQIIEGMYALSAITLR